MPISAPISACEELEGRPARQVMRFQMMAPNSTATSIESATPPAGATRLPIVFATSAWSNCVVTTAPTRLRKAEKMTATRGGNARVPTVVPMAFAVSWKPLVKSKKSATAMVRTRRSVCASGILDRDALQRRIPVAEEFGDGAARGRVAHVFEPVNLDEVSVVPLARFELVDHPLELRHRLCEKPSQLARGSGDVRDPVQVGRVGDLLDVVEDVVETGREGVDVLVVEGGNEGTIEGAHDLVGKLVSLVLEVLDLLLARWEIRHVGEGSLEQISGTYDYRSLLFEELVEATLTGDERQCLSILAQYVSKPPTLRRGSGWLSRWIRHPILCSS